MTRNLKALCLSMLVTVAAGAVAASGAQAEAMFEAESYPATTESHSEESSLEIGLNGITIKCSTHRIHKEKVEETTTTVDRMETEAHNCTFFGAQAILKTLDCTTSFTLPEKVPPITAKTDVTCEKSVGTEIETLGCTAIIPPQEGLEGVAFENIGEGAERQLKMSMNISEMEYSTSGLLCGNTEGSNGTMTSEGVFTGYDEAGEQQGIYISE